MPTFNSGDLDYIAKLNQVDTDMHDASKLTTGLMPLERLAANPAVGKFLRGDQQWVSVSITADDPLNPFLLMGV
jgi:hypothetical protein